MLSEAINETIPQSELAIEDSFQEPKGGALGKGGSRMSEELGQFLTRRSHRPRTNGRAIAVRPIAPGCRRPRITALKWRSLFATPARWVCELRTQPSGDPHIHCIADQQPTASLLEVSSVDRFRGAGRPASGKTLEPLGVLDIWSDDTE
jgi:hypothetical protein